MRPVRGNTIVQNFVFRQASGTTLCGSQNFFDNRRTIQLAARKYLTHMVGNILLGAVEKRRFSLPYYHSLEQS